MRLLKAILSVCPCHSIIHRWMEKKILHPTYNLKIWDYLRRYIKTSMTMSRVHMIKIKFWTSGKDKGNVEHFAHNASSLQSVICKVMIYFYYPEIFFLLKLCYINQPWGNYILIFEDGCVCGVCVWGVCGCVWGVYVEYWIIYEILMLITSVKL